MTPLTGYSYCKAITISHLYIDADQSAFPNYIPIKADTDIGGHLQDTTNCYDVRFTASDGTTLLKFEAESRVVTTGAFTANYWVKSNVSGTEDTLIYIHYGKADDTDGADPTNVWSAGYQGVYHLKDDPNTSTVQDSTSNNRDGTKTSAGNPAEATGKIWKGQDFDDNVAQIDLGTNFRYTSENFSIGYLIYFIANAEVSFFTGQYAQKGYYLEHGSAGDIAFYTNQNTAAQITYNASPSLLTANAWNHVVVTRNGATVKIYLNGAEVTYGNQATHINPAAQNENTLIGRYSTATSNTVSGILDEFRILSTTVLAASWIKWEYNNIFQTNNELTWGAEESGGWTSGGSLVGNMVI